MLKSIARCKLFFFRNSSTIYRLPTYIKVPFTRIMYAKNQTPQLNLIFIRCMCLSANCCYWNTISRRISDLHRVTSCRFLVIYIYRYQTFHLNLTIIRCTCPSTKYCHWNTVSVTLHLWFALVGRIDSLFRITIYTCKHAHTQKRV